MGISKCNGEQTVTGAFLRLIFAIGQNGFRGTCGKHQVDIFDGFEQYKCSIEMFPTASNLNLGF